MFRFIFLYEFKQLLRSKWIQILSLLLVVLFGFAGFNGKEKVAKRQAVILEAKNQVEQEDVAMLKLLDSVERKMTVSASPWMIPDDPMVIGRNHPRVAAMEPQLLSFISTGQADIFTHYVKPTVFNDDFALNFTEMASPVQLLFGSFDIAFVIVYLLPLLIIAFSYNVLSSEKERGTLRLLASQPINIHIWILQKLGLRFFWLSILVIMALLLILTLLGFNVTDLTGLSKFLGLVLAYALFWFVLAFLISLRAKSSAKNAVSLIGLWIVFVLLVPSILNQLSGTLYPMPSRTLMINEMRALKAEMIEKQDEILDNFLRDHPEYAINDNREQRNFYHRFIASQELVKKELAPLVKRYETQLYNQQSWLDRFKWMSPAIILKESINKIAGTSTSDYEYFRKQVIAFSEDWRNHFIPLLYNNREFSQVDYPKLPSFTYHQKIHDVSGKTAYLIVISFGLMGIGILFSRKRIQHQLFKSV